MQKVYLLLRNNQQTGPHSFEELLQLQLKPFDLIWVEGKSYGWRYPTEVEALKSYIKTPDPVPEMSQEETIPSIARETNPAAPHLEPVRPKKVFVSMPVNARQQSQSQLTPTENYIDPIEQKAEELRKRAQAYIPQQEAVKTNYARRLDDAEEEYTQWAYQKKTKKKTLLTKKHLTIGVSIFLLVACMWAGSYFFNSSPVASENTVLQQKENNKTSAITDKIEPEEPVSLPPNTDLSTKPTIKIKEKNKKQPAAKIAVPSQPNTPEVIILQDEPQQTREEITTETKDEPVAELPAEKKKTLKEKIGDLLKKGKSEQPSVTDQETKGTDNSNNERKATRRGEENETSGTVTDVSNQVEVKTNKIADSWMMGVKNMKLTLYNRSDLTINAAKVEVLYFSEQNNLLDKKVLSFSNIPPKKSQTVAAPDLRMADHIEYKILSATGIENAYARQ